jgi:hypothetical protein
MTQIASDTSTLPIPRAPLGGLSLVLRAEGFAGLAAAAAAYGWLGFSWGLFALLFLAPDLAMAGYAFGPKWGAAAYNVVHSTLAPLALGAVAFALRAPLGEAVALIFLAHIGFDRALGYGLKYASGFGDTHFGRIGRSTN